jgi:hypothetical protein
MATTIRAPHHVPHLDHVSVVISIILGFVLVVGLIYLFAPIDIPQLGFWSDVNMAP